MPLGDASLLAARANGDSLFLRAGDVCASDKPTILSTVLGSCVSVCLWDRWRRAGGMNHFQRPRENEYTDFLSGRAAIRRLLQHMYRLGSQRNHLYALLFGGAQLIDAFAGVNDVGADNIAVAERTLDETGIAVVYRDVGGTRARKLFFRTDTGGYAVKLLPLGAA